jgi:hypothetical protein
MRGQTVIWNYRVNKNFAGTDFGYRSLPLGTAPVRADGDGGSQHGSMGIPKPEIIIA